MQAIKPKVQYVIWMIIISFIIFALLFLSSPYLISDWKVSSLAILFTTLAITLLWGLDRSHLYIKLQNDLLILRGYFNIRKIELNINEIKGYQTQEKVDKLNGLHKEIQLKLNDGKVIPFPRVAYPNYECVESLCKYNFNFLGNSNIKYGELLGKLLPVMGLVSGILALIVAIMKFIR
ncbi:MAG TPA: hypothetical protein PKL31_15460 [Fulvivirga sp.]|nr:hypothetical protein [Fulvivirga sp.]